MVKKLIFIEIKKCINPKIIFAFCFFTIIFLSTFFCIRLVVPMYMLTNLVLMLKLMG